MINLKPTISVIIPTYNRGDLIEKSIRSVLNQSYGDLELIVVDDGSTDKTEEVVKAIDDSRVIFIKNKNNKGGAAARNIGIKVAKGDFIGFQDDDDEWLPKKLEKQIKILQKSSSDVGVVYTGFWRVKENKYIYIPLKSKEVKEGDIHKSLLEGSFVSTQTMLLRKECFKTTGLFDENLPRLQDWELAIRLSKNYLFKLIDEPLVLSYYTPISISSNQQALVIALEIILAKHFGDFKLNNSLSAIYSTLGQQLCLNMDFKRGQKFLIEAAKINPTNAKLLIMASISILGPKIYMKIMEVHQKLMDRM
jgi:glycosyltransferase involved in cell wall biosynthesis